MKTKIMILVLLLGAVFAQNKKGILVVSFGTSYPETRKLCIESIENDVKDKFQNYEVKRAFTSRIIRKKIKKRDGIEILSPAEAIDKMIAEGFKEIYVQSLHIIPGSEYHDLAHTVLKRGKGKDVKIKFGHPLLAEETDYRNTISALMSQTEKFSGKHIVFIGHGTHHPANACYSQLQNMMKEKNEKLHIANIEGYPELPLLIKKLKKENVKEVVLMPLMIVAGDHAKNDIASDENDSWKTILKNHGIEAEVYLHGLGENKEIRKIFIHTLEELISGKTETKTHKH
ncbi:MAG: sirohydrochlorin cobaltochelatase [Rhodothermaceae bacterium]